MVRNKRLISVIAVFLMMLTLVPNVSFASDFRIGHWTDEDVYDISWYTANPSSSTYNIGTGAELGGLAVLCMGMNGQSKVDFGGKTINITGDIDLGDFRWMPIDKTSGKTLTIVGNGHIISNLICSNLDDGAEYVPVYAGLFGEANNVKLSGLTFKGVNFSLNFATDKTYYGGAVAGKASNVTIEGCAITSSTMGVNGYVGGYIGYATGGVTINRCNNGANVTGFRAGGFVGESSGNISMTRCYNSGKVSASYTNPTSTSDIPMAGGIIGCVSGGNYNVTYSYNIKAISANVSGLECEAGGIVGDLAGTYDLSDLGLVNNTGSITSNSIAGGVFGRLSNTQDQNILTYAFNTGGVSGTDYAGGIVGVWNDSTDGASMMSCYSIGTVTGGTTGALVGKVANSNDSGLVDLFASACYYGEKSADKIVGECNEYTRSIGENEMVSMDYVTSGRLTRMLNILNNGTGEYGQNLDNGKFKDSYPVLIGNYDEGIHDSVYEVTVTACDGSTSTVYTNTESYVTENVTHQIGYTAKNNVLTATCSVCKNTGTATLGFASSVDSSDINYTGSDIEPMEVSYDDGWSNLGLSSDLNITYSNNTNAGTATAKIASGGATASRNFTIKGTASSDKSFKRYYGSSRYDTSLAAAGAVKENLGVDKFDNVIITSGENFADALSGAYLAKLRNAPILGVNSATESRIQTYIDENLKADGTVYILGGTGAVSKKLENALAKDGFTIKRLGGANRYETNLEILKECEVNGADILVCSGTGYADSLSASASGRPIMLVANGFSKDQQAYLDGISTGTMYIIGGTGAVNAATAKAAANYGTTKRLGGATRYDTSVLVAEEFFTGNCDNLVLAYGQNFPDGLSGGPLALTLDAPLILTQNNSTVSQKAADFAAKKNVKFIAVLGGTALISDGTVQKILN